MAFSAANGQMSTAVAAMAASSEGLVDGAITGATRRGLYTSLDAGQSWTYDFLSDPGGATDPTSTTAVVYNEGAGKFFAAIRPSHNLSVSLTIAQNFLVTSSTASQTATAGQTSGAYALRVLPIGSSFNGAVSLDCSAGLPAGAQCVFNPSTPVTPGNSVVDVVMNISTRANSARSDMPVSGNFPLSAVWIPLAAIVIGASVSGNRNRTKARQLSECVVFCLMMMAFVSCAGVSNGGGGGGQPPPPVTYHITVIGTSSGTAPDAGQSTTVTLVVN